MWVSDKVFIKSDKRIIFNVKKINVFMESGVIDFKYWPIGILNDQHKDGPLLNETDFVFQI